MPTPVAPDHDKDAPLNSRLQAEIDDILSRARPLPPPTPISSARSRKGQLNAPQLAQRTSAIQDLLFRVPLLSALILAVAAMVLDSLPVIPELLVIGALFMIFSPLILGRETTLEKEWRGRRYTTTTSNPNASDAIRRWWNRVRPRA